VYRKNEENMNTYVANERRCVIVFLDEGLPSIMERMKKA
jgi:hypothetical protein